MRYSRASIRSLAWPMSARAGGCNQQQREELEIALEGAERIVTADGPLRALEAIESFTCNLTKCKRGTTIRNLLARLKEQIKESQYALITEHYTAERETLIEV